MAPLTPGGDGTLAAKDTGDQLLRQVQKALTISKRCETKMRKLAETKATRQVQWKAWKEQLKTSFLRQQQQFEKDQAELDTEIASLRAQGEEAAMSMQQLVLHGPAAMETETQAVTQSGNGAWEELMGSAVPEGPGTDFMRQAYAFAQMVMQRQGSGSLPTSGQWGLGVMPPHLMEQMVGCPPAPGAAPLSGMAENSRMAGHHGGQANNTAPPAAHVAPTYSATDTNQVRNGPLSRSPMAGGMCLDGRHSGPAPTGLEAAGPPGLVPQTPAPVAPQTGTVAPEEHAAGPTAPSMAFPDGGTVNTSPLPEMLRSKRQEARRAMEPFGIARPDSERATKSEEAGRPPGGAANQDFAFIEDDGESKEASNGIQASPGLGRLE